MKVRGAGYYVTNHKERKIEIESLNRKVHHHSNSLRRGRGKSSVMQQYYN